MGRRSRKRGAAGRPDGPSDGPRPASVPPVPRSPRPRRFADAALSDDRPKAPWHPFPLVELSALVGLVLMVLGLVSIDQARGQLMFLFGMALGSLAGLDTVLRDHLAGLRSHSSVLAGLPTVLTAVALGFLRVPWPVVLAVAVVVFGAAFAALRALFARRSGGVRFR